MGALMKLLFCVAVSVLLLQTAHGKEPKDVDESKRPPVEEEVQQVLQGLEKMENGLTKEIDRHIKKATEYVTAAEAQIPYAKSTKAVQRSAKRSLAIARKDVRKTRSIIRNNICKRVEEFKRLVKRDLPPDMELTELAKTPDFETKLHLGDTKQDSMLYKQLTHGHRVSRQLRHKKEQDPSTLAEWKKYFKVKSDESLKTYTTEMKAIKGASQRALHTLYNAIAVWAGADNSLKDGEEAPKNIDEKAAIVGAALSLEDKLDCAFEAPAATPPAVEAAAPAAGPAADPAADAAEVPEE